MSNTLFVEDLPSKRQALLNRLKGQKIQRLIRYSEMSAEQLTQEYDLTAEECFSMTIGPMVIAFESGLQVGLLEDLDLNSVKIRVEQTETGEQSPLAFVKDREFFSLEAGTSVSEPFWNRIPGQVIRDIRIIRRKPINVRFEDLPNEIALRFELESGDDFVAGCGVSKGSYDFHVISKQAVDPGLLPDLIGWE